MTFRVNERNLVKIEFAPGGAETDPKSVSKWFEFPAHNGNSINLVHISAGAVLRAPAMKLSITDNLRFFEWLKEQGSKGIADGAHIRVTMSEDTPSTRTPQVRFFRVYSWRKQSSGDLGYTYEFDCYWDSVQYWLQARRVGNTMSSSGMLQAIAGFCKLTWHTGNTTTTTDSQLWVPGNRPMSIWAKAIAQAGFVNSQSHMIFGIDSLGAMRYLDLNKEVQESSLKKAVSLQALDTGLPSGINSLHVAQEFVAKTRAGINNSLGGYAYTLVEQFLPTPKSLEAYTGDSSLLSAFTNNMDSTETSRNPELPGIIENRNIIDVRPIGVKGVHGTVHEKYEEARSQNYLYNLLNSTVGEFAFHRMTDWEIGDRFFYRPPLGEYGLPDDITLDVEFAGEFSVSSKTILITGTSYVEKVVAARNGVGRKSQ